MNNSINKNKFKIIFISSLLILIIIIIISIYNKENKLTVSNFQDFSKNIPIERINSINSRLQDLTSKNKKIKLSKNDAKIREGTFTERLQDDVYGSDFIIDIPKAQQSYKIYIAWTSKNKDLQGDALKFDCPVRNEIIYKNFDCIKALNLDKEIDDPIVGLLPYSTFNYKIILNSKIGNKTKITINIFTYSSDLINGNNSVAVEKYKKQATDWMTSKGLNLNNYEISYKIY